CDRVLIHRPVGVSSVVVTRSARGNKQGAKDNYGEYKSHRVSYPGINLCPWPQAHYFSGRSRPIRAHLIAPVSFRAVERGVSHLDQLNWIAPIFRVRRNANANRYVMSPDRISTVTTHGWKIIFLDRGSHALGRNH